MDLRNKHRQVLDEKVAGKRTELSFIQSEITRTKYDINAKSDAIRNYEAEINSLDAKMDKLRSDWREENAKVLNLNNPKPVLHVVRHCHKNNSRKQEIRRWHNSTR